MERDPVLERLFDDAVPGIDPPVAELVTGSQHLGRKLRLRRRLRIAGAALTVTALAATGTAVRWWPGGDTARQAVASAPADVTAPSSTLEPVTPEAMLQILSGVLPPDGKLTDFVGRSGRLAASGLPSQLGVVYDDGSGASELEVGIQPTQVPAPDLSCDGYQGHRSQVVSAPSCTTRVLPDGTKLQTLGSGDGRGHVYSISVHAFRPDGVHVWISAANGLSATASGATRPEPPLGTGLLEKVASSPAWQLTVEHTTTEQGRRLAAGLGAHG
ncbi:hypothetical protein KCMC57_up47080 [Kitasatospora sp. CMC57]|uniref:Uncharacterized protein n=1 Tax=Kitasatospora sp. CMC57 TaxID=3231513 RepID=A0AB33JZC4_9ACTN